MIRLRPGLWRMESSSSWGCNTYLIEDEGRVFLVDPGPKFQLERVARELRAAGRSPYDVTDVLLTHYDQDHSRSAAELRRRTGATVYLGAEDAQILRSHQVPGSWQRRFMMRLLGLAELPEGTVELRGEVAISPGLTALPSPGHTPGHYAFLWRDVAFVGDAANCGPDGELVPFDRALMTDPVQADATREMLCSLPVRLFCAAHSDPVERGTTPLAQHTHRIHIDALVEDVFRFVEGTAGPGDDDGARPLGERLESWTVLHPHVPALRLALAAPTLAWRLGLGPVISRIGNARSHLVMLTVTGRRSGVPRHLPVALHQRGEETYLWCPYGSRAQWYRNVVANPLVTVQSSEGARAMRADAVDDGDHLLELVADLREFDETFLRSYLASEGIEDTPEAIAANAHRVHVRRLEPTTEPGPPPLQADLAWAWLIPPALIAAVIALRTRHSPR